MSPINELLKHQSFMALTPDQVSSFMTHGFLRLPGAIPLDNCDRWTKDLWLRLGMDPDDKSTWTTEWNTMSKLNVAPAAELAPAAWAAICEICGGEDRIAKGGEMWTDGFIVNLGSVENEGKVIEPKKLTAWHVDGNFFTHFLDSPEQALLVIPCWSDVEENAGATVICTEGPKLIGKLLVRDHTRCDIVQNSAMANPLKYDHPEGLNPMMGPRENHLDIDPKFFNSIVQDAPDDSFFEMTGNKGDVILMHPLMLHSASKNSRRLARSSVL
jgi:hypothetical protein